MTLDLKQSPPSSHFLLKLLIKVTQDSKKFNGNPQFQNFSMKNQGKEDFFVTLLIKKTSLKWSLLGAVYMDNIQLIADAVQKGL